MKSGFCRHFSYISYQFSLSLRKIKDISFSKIGQKHRKMTKERCFEVVKKEAVGEAGGGEVTVPVFVLFAFR